MNLREEFKKTNNIEWCQSVAEELAIKLEQYGIYKTRTFINQNDNTIELLFQNNNVTVNGSPNHVTTKRVALSELPKWDKYSDPKAHAPADVCIEMKYVEDSLDKSTFRNNRIDDPKGIKFLRYATKELFIKEEIIKEIAQELGTTIEETPAPKSDTLDLDDIS